MADIQRISQISGLNLYVNPLLKNDGDLIRAVNVTSDQYGSKTKRPGYETYLGTANGSAVDSLFSFYKNDGTTFWNYRASGGLLYYSSQGTGAWTIAGNGTLTAGAKVGYAILDNTLILGEGVLATRHTTDGTSFTDTTIAPVSNSFSMYQNRIYAAGTSSSLFYSTTGDATNWSTGGTSDSSSLTIPGAGKLHLCFTANDKVVAVKNSGKMFKWDGYSLIDMATDLGPSSPQSYAKIEDYSFWLNRLGIFGYGGARPQILSNPIEKQIYNNSGSAIVGSTFDTAPASIYRYDYLVAVGTLTDDFTTETINDAIIKYDFNKNEFINWSFANFPTAFHTYQDENGVDQLIWGDSTGQCYQLSGTETSDNGSRIESIMEFIVYLQFPEYDKIWNWLWVITNPGCDAKISVAFTDTYTRASLNWIEIGDCRDGNNRFRLPQNSRSKFMFIKIYESSLNKPFTIYGLSVDGKVMPI